MTSSKRPRVTDIMEEIRTGPNPVFWSQVYSRIVIEPFEDEHGAKGAAKVIAFFLLFLVRDSVVPPGEELEAVWLSLTQSQDSYTALLDRMEKSSHGAGWVMAQTRLWRETYMEDAWAEAWPIIVKATSKAVPRHYAA